MTSKLIAPLAAAAALALAGTAAAESRTEQANRVFTKSGGPSAACALLSNDEVVKITGRRSYSQPEGTQLTNDGASCDYTGVNVTLFSGPKSDENYDKLVKNFMKDNSSRQVVAGVGDSAYLWFPKPRDQYEGNHAILVAHQGVHTVAVSLEAQGSETPQSLQPRLTAMAKAALAKLR
jgi:hypothetical protein